MLTGDLPRSWREMAKNQRLLGAEAQAKTLEWCALELENSFRSAQDTLLNLTEASQVSGYSSTHLGRLIKDGKIQNYGRPNAPRARQADLPRKALRREGPNLELLPRGKCEVVRSIVNQ